MPKEGLLGRLGYRQYTPWVLPHCPLQPIEQRPIDRNQIGRDCPQLFQRRTAEQAFCSNRTEFQELPEQDLLTRCINNRIYPACVDGRSQFAGVVRLVTNVWIGHFHVSSLIQNM